MNKRFIFFLVLFVGLFIFSPSVFALDDVVLRVETNIHNWNPRSELEISYCSELPDGFYVEHYLEQGEVKRTLVSNSFYANYSNDFEEGSIVTFVEEIHVDSDNTEISSLDLGLRSIDFYPSQIVLSPAHELSSNDTLNDFVFQDYNYESLTIYYKVLNVTDSIGNITGERYITGLSFSNDSFEKVTSYSLGDVSIPTFLGEYHFYVRGNIAQINGSFFIRDWLDSDYFYSYLYNSNDENVFNIEIEDWDVLDSLNTDACYGLGEDSSTCSSRYSITVSNHLDQLYRCESSLCIPIDVEARLDSTVAITGLFYNIWPYFIVIILLFIGIFVLRKSTIQKN